MTRIGLHRRSPWALLALVLVLLVSARVTTAQSVTYPILVYSTSPGQHDVPVTINVAQASQATRLCVTAHQASYHLGEYVWADWSRRDDAAGISLNGGAFVTDWNATGDVDFPADRYEGVGGGFHTVRVCFSLDSGALGSVSEGANTITFRFYGVQDDARSGYRVIDIDVENSGGTDLIQGETQDDPEAWTIANTVGSAYDNPSAIAEGAALWSERNSLTEIGSGASLTAACSDCHAASGFDLQYFNFESEVIVTRAAHHGLTEDEGRKIAAYIRSLDLNRTDGRGTAPKGRPWNPPYQPGPALTDGLEEDWAAGAGLEFVLAHDHETFDYLFSQDGVTPNPNPSATDMASALHVGTHSGDAYPENHGNLVPVQNIPVAIQYPDWNNWLPDVHPLDGFSSFESSEIWGDMQVFRTSFDTQAEVDAAVDDYREYLATGRTAPRPELVLNPPDVSVDVYQATNGGPIAAPQVDPTRHELTLLGYEQWQSVRLFEVYNSRPMKGLMDDIAAGLTVPSGFQGDGEALRVQGSLGSHKTGFMWPGIVPVVFDMAPHKSSHFFGEGQNEGGFYGPPGTAIMNYYFSTAWYDVQLMLTSENMKAGRDNGGDPVDWAYMAALLSDTQSASGVSQYARLVRQRAFAWQTRNNRYSRESMERLNSWQRLIDTNLYKLMGGYADLPGNWYGGLHDDPQEALDVLWAAINEWTEYVESVPNSEWVRASDTDAAWDPQSYTPQPYPGNGRRYMNKRWADNVYRLCAEMEENGAPQATLTRLATWGESMWPNGNWEQWVSGDPDPEPPSVGMTSPSSGSVYTAPASVAMSASAEAPSAAVEWVRFLVDGEVVATDTSSPYAHTQEGLGPGTYTLAARVRDALGQTADSAPVTVTVEAPDPDPPTVALTNPADGAAFDAPASVALVASAEAPGSAVEWVRFLVDGEVVATDTSSPYAHVLEDLGAGTYTLAARVRSAFGDVTDSDNVTITVSTPDPPTVALTSPESGATYESPATVELAASAEAPSAAVEWVRFLVDGEVVATDTSSPYAHTQEGLGPGTYTLAARVRDALGQTADSAPVTVTVEAPDPDPPTVALTNPADGAAFDAPASVALVASAEAPGSAVEWVRFLVDGEVVATDTSSPYAHVLEDLGAGTYTLAARVRSAFGDVTDSDNVTITVNPDDPDVEPPTVALTSPDDEAVFGAPATVELAASAEAPSAAIEWVRFFVDGEVATTDATAPYAHVLADLGAGTYTLSARVRDALGQTADSAPVTVTVEAPDPDPPTVALTSPESGATYESPATVELAASAEAPSAAVEWVRFFVDGEVATTDATAPYAHVLADLGAGTYTLSARVRDALGQTADSAPVTVTVEAPPPSAQQTIPLGEGWNMVSSFVAPSDSTISVVLADVIDQIVVVQDGDGRVFLPQDGVNTLGFWRQGDAYQIYAESDIAITVAGEPLPPGETPIVIGEGADSPVWGQVAFIGSAPMPVDDALVSIADSLLVVKDNFGLVYMPEVGVDQIGELTPGQGYKIYVSSEATLIYPPGGQQRVAKRP